jgi:hypothetical protein
MRKTPLLLFFVVFTLLFSCRLRPFDDVTTEGGTAEWAIPLIDSKKSFNDIVKDFDKQAFLQIAPDGGLVLHYEGDYIARSSLDIFSQFQNAFFPISDTVMTVPFTTPKGVHIDNIDIKRGTLRWGMAAPNDALLVKIMIPQLTLNGVPFQRSFTLTRLGVLDTLNLAGWKLNPDKDSIYIIHDARKFGSGERVNLKGNGGFQIQNFEFAFVKGFLGRDTFDVPRDTIEMDFASKWKQGQLQFTNPKMVLTIDNSIGFPVKAIQRVTDILTINGKQLTLQSPLSKGIDINYPTFSEIGKSKRTIITLDKNNSNLADILSANPIAIDYDIDGVTNSDINTTPTGFLTDSSNFKLQVTVDLPIEGTAKDFTIADTFDVDFSQYSNVTYGEFKINTENGIPLDLALQGYFCTPNGSIIDSFYTQKSLILRGAPVNTNGLPRSVQNQENSIKVEGTKFKKILPAKKLIIQYSFSTTNNGTIPVKLMANQSVRIRVGTRFGIQK